MVFFFLRRDFKIRKAISLLLYEIVTSLDQEEKDILDHNVLTEVPCVAFINW